MPATFEHLEDKTALATLADEDVFYVVDDPGGSPLDRKVLASVILAYMEANIDELTFTNSGLHILDSNASHDLIVSPGSNLTADRTLTITTGDSDRTLTLDGNATLNDWFDQSVKQAASPTFTGLQIGSTISGNYSEEVQINGKLLVGNAATADSEGVLHVRVDSEDEHLAQAMRSELYYVVADETSGDTKTSIFGLSVVQHPTGTIDKVIGVDAWASNDGSAGTDVGWLMGVRAGLTGSADPTTDEAACFYANPIGHANVTTLYGLYIEAVTAGGTNYAIYTNSGLVYFGDTVQSGHIGVNQSPDATHAIDVAQAADDGGLRIAGYDDQSGETASLAISNAGMTTLTASGQCKVTSGGTIFITSGDQIRAQLAAGGYFDVRNSSNTAQIRVLESTGDLDVRVGHLKISNDSKFLYLGTSLDATITYDGTNLVVNPQRLGTGSLVISNGSLGVGESSPDYKLDVNGDIGFTPGSSVTPVDNGDVVFELTNDTTLTIKAKGSDGTVRSGTVTLS